MKNVLPGDSLMKSPVFAKKIMLDIVMILVIASIYSKNVISLMYHEVMGLVLLMLFVIHVVFNRSFISRVTPGIFSDETTRKVKLHWILDILLIISWSAVGVTGILISKKLFSFRINALIPWHFFSAAVSLALTGIHIGFHWNYLRNWIHRCFPGTLCIKKTMKVLIAASVLYGCFSLVTGSVGTWTAAPFRSHSEEQRYNVERSISAGEELNTSGAGSGLAPGETVESHEHAAVSSDSLEERQKSSAARNASAESARGHAAQPFSPVKLLLLALNIFCVMMFFAFISKSVDKYL